MTTKIPGETCPKCGEYCLIVSEETMVSINGFFDPESTEKCSPVSDCCGAEMEVDDGP